MTHEGNKKNNLWPHNRLEYYISRLLWRMDVVGDELLAYVDAVDETARIKKNDSAHASTLRDTVPRTQQRVTAFHSKRKIKQFKFVLFGIWPLRLVDASRRARRKE